MRMVISERLGQVHRSHHEDYSVDEKNGVALVA